ncbi:MAG: methyltransferase [Spirochaeta sp.]|jgi:protein-S-isoprenylcysteine O-methyltransferase Ste14|nr:methyltransferase [Spirochaeta sp.]
MNQEIWSYYGLWGTAALWAVLCMLFLLFVPFYRRVERKPAGVFAAFAVAFAFEMFGIPLSLYVVFWISGRFLPLGVLWGYTLSGTIGMAGHYVFIGALVVGGGLVVAGWARIYRDAWSRDEEDACLVRDGVYRYLRHPQYTGLILIATGALCDWATIPLLLLWPVLVFRYVGLARLEERELATRFGAEWRAYRETTGMFAPRIGLRRGHRPEDT